MYSRHFFIFAFIVYFSYSIEGKLYDKIQNDSSLQIDRKIRTKRETTLLNNTVTNQNGNPASDEISKHLHETITNFSAPNVTLPSQNVTSTDKPFTSKPGATKRAALVFGGFALMGVIYFAVKIYCWKKSPDVPKNLASQPMEGMQFRYGVLKSEENNLEMANIPLTLESEDEDDDDFEVFDLTKSREELFKLKDPSHQPPLRDSEIVHSSTKNHKTDGPNSEAFLLEIDDNTSEPLIDITNSGPHNSRFHDLT